MGRNKRTIKARGMEVGGSVPAICAPLIGQDTAELSTECEQIMSKKPDMIEWRADFFHALQDLERVSEALRAIREKVGNVPLLFTIRSVHEGGQPISLTDREMDRLIARVCQTGLIDFVDYELRNGAQRIQSICETAKQNGVYVILSYHNFKETPDLSTILAKFEQMEQSGADLAKVALMPNGKGDALTLLRATEMAREKLSIPLIAISMGSEGAITRIAGWMFGSAVTFAVGNESSAPGQIPIEQLRLTIDHMKQATK